MLVLELLSAYVRYVPEAAVAHATVNLQVLVIYAGFCCIIMNDQLQVKEDLPIIECALLVG